MFQPARPRPVGQTFILLCRLELSGSLVLDWLLLPRFARLLVRGLLSVKNRVLAQVQGEGWHGKVKGVCGVLRGEA